MPKKLPVQPKDRLEYRRLRAWELHMQGWSQQKIAREIGVTQGAVSQWLKRAREGGGVAGLHSSTTPGRQPALTAEQFAQLPALINRGAEAFGFQGNHWTTKRVAAVVKQVFGVSYHPGHVSRVLKKYCPGWREQS